MFIVECLFIRLSGSVDHAIEMLRSAIGQLEKGWQVQVLHDPKSPWLTIKDRIDLNPEQRRIFQNAMAEAGLGEMIEMSWDDQWGWTTYSHIAPGHMPRRFIKHPEPDEGQSPWVLNLGGKEPWENYAEVPEDSDLQAMAAFHQLPGITFSGNLDFPDEWDLRRNLVLAGKGPATPPPLIDPNSIEGLLKRIARGEVLPVSDAIRLLMSGSAITGPAFLSESMRTHRVYAQKPGRSGKRQALRGSDKKLHVPVLTTLEDFPGKSPQELALEFSAIFTTELIDQLEANQGLAFDLHHEGPSLHVDAEDVPGFRKMIADISGWWENPRG